jgi:hypothetical protein
VSERVEVQIRLGLNGFTLDVAWTAGDGEAFRPVRPGKTLTLQHLAGLVRQAGRIVDGRVLFDSAAGFRAATRSVPLRFQGYAVSHLTVDPRRLWLAGALAERDQRTAR